MGPKRAGGVHPYQAPSARGGVLALPLDNLNCARPSASLARHTSLPAQPVPLPVASAPRLCSPPLLLPSCRPSSTHDSVKGRLSASTSRGREGLRAVSSGRVEAGGLARTCDCPGARGIEPAPASSQSARRTASCVLASCRSASC
jgi:hypothetical protein